MKDWFYNTLADIYLRMRFMSGVWQWGWHCAPTASGAVQNMERAKFLWRRGGPTPHTDSPITRGCSLRRPRWDAHYQEDMRWMEYGRGSLDWM